MRGSTIIVIISISLFIAMSYLAVQLILAPSPNSDYLDQNGVNGTAIILDTQQTGIYIQKNPQVKFKLEVTVPGKDPYEVNYTKILPYINTPKFQPGDKYYVLIDPNNPQILKFTSKIE